MPRVKHNKRLIIPIVIMTFILMLMAVPIIWASEDAKLNRQAHTAIRQGNLDRAFMHYRGIDRNRKPSPYKDDAIFAIGEYNYLISNYTDALHSFERYIDVEEQDIQKLFAYVYLLKIAEHDKDDKKAVDYKKIIKTYQKHVFLFSEQMEYSFASPLDRHHRVVYSIDKIELFIEGDLFAKIEYSKG